MHNLAPRYCRTECTTHPRSPAATFSAHRSAPHDAHHVDPHRARDISRPTFPLTPLLARIAAADFTSCESRRQPFTRGIARTRDVPVAWPSILFAYARENVGVVAVGPFFEAGIACSGDRTGSAATSETGGCQTGRTSASDVGGEGLRGRGQGRGDICSYLCRSHT